MINGSNELAAILNRTISEDFQIYLVNHQTIQSFARSYGWSSVRNFFKEIKIGIKVFDEAHLEFRNILLIDMFSNAFKTFYLTANFFRSSTKENRIFNTCFSAACKFGEETSHYAEKRKHIHYVPVLYRSSPSYQQILSTRQLHGFSKWKFSNYALYKDNENIQLKALFRVLDAALKLSGRILITAPQIQDTEYIRNMIMKYYDSGKTVGTIHSKNSADINLYVKEHSDIICSTVKSSGTGVDFSGLRCIINLQPFKTPVEANQLAGRLREYAKDEDTYFFDLVDLAFEDCERMYNARKNFLKDKCKQIDIWRLR